MKKQYPRLLTTLLALPLILGSCAREGDDIDSDGGAGTLVTMSISVPGTATPSSRAMTTPDESAVAEIDLLLFNVPAAGGGFVYHTRVGEVSIDGNRKGVFNVRLPKGTYDIVLIANASDEVAAVLPSVNYLNDINDVQQSLTFTQSGKWPANSPSHRPIPMWAEIAGAEIEEGATIAGGYLMRALAKINVEVAATANFTMSEIYLYNPAEDGYLMPWAASVSGTPPQVHSYSADLAWTRKATPHHYSGAEVSAYACKNEIYTFETPKGDGTPDRGAYLDEGNTFLVVGGKWNGDAGNSWYRIDFAKDDGAYLPLLRNHRYEVVIKDAPYRGEASASDAAGCGPSNLLAELVVRNEADMHYYVYDDGFFIGADDREFSLEADAGTFTFDVATDYPGGWKAVASDSATDPTAGVTGAWLTTTATGGLGTAPLAFSFTHNPENDRVAFIHILAGDRLDAVVKVTQAFKFDLGHITPTPLSHGYVGAFWRKDQTGERLIKITRSFQDDPTSIDGTWTATVVEGDDWIVLDTSPTADGAVGSANPGDAELYQVNSTLTSVSGNAGTTEDIYFRIGLRSTYTPTATEPVRYGIVLLKYNHNTKKHLIFIRQGEDADYLMRPQDNNAAGDLHNSSGGTAAQPRPAAVKWSPYNLTAAAFNSGNTSDYIQLAARGGVWTDYPSQAGAFFQFMGYSGEERRAHNPVTMGSIRTTNVTGYWDALKATHETCPTGYRRANDGSTSAANSAGAIANSEYRQSLWLNPAAGSGVGNLDNSIWGFYADGFFDRRNITGSPGNNSPNTNPSAVQTGDTRVAYMGRLFYNPNNYASLFIPAAGYRSSSGLNIAGSIGYYWSSSSYSTTYGWRLLVGQSRAYQNYGTRYDAFSVRCVPE